MVRSRYKTLLPLVLVAVLLGLLVVLAGLQYRWLGQISDAERSRLRTRLSEDTRRFSEDFNREIQTAFFNFQVPAAAMKAGERTEFLKRYLYWTSNSAYPELIEGIYFYRAGDDKGVLRFDPEVGQFEKAAWNERLNSVRSEIGDGKQMRPIIGARAALAIPVYEESGELKHLIVRSRNFVGTEELKTKEPREVQLPDKYGFLIVLLDREVMTGKIFPELVARYFSDSDSANYELEVQDAAGNPVFRKGEGKITDADSEATILDVKPNGFNFIAERTPASGMKKANGSRMLVTEKFESKRIDDGKTGAEGNTTVDVNIFDSSGPAVTVFESKGAPSEGAWILKVQHYEGSLDQFVANTRRRNLAVSFGILSLLAVSVILIFISTQRAKTLARNQLDFVSAVSHEFRTPLAVIYSAAENLSDGVVADKEKISDYGSLIKREGKKLSGMVEQILEFAGARSGKRRFDFRELDAGDLVRKAIAECAPQIEESGFELETDIRADLPRISGDELALTQAVQNLVSNAIKYSNGNRWMKVSVQNGGGEVKIVVEDKGIGISRKDAKHIFEPFYRAGVVVDEQISGNGLGLSLVRQIVDAHHGNVTVESEPGKGSRFVMSLKAVG